MLSFTPSDGLINHLKKAQSQIEAAATLIVALPVEERAYLERSALVSTIGASTRIENAVLTDAEIEWVDTTLTADGKTTAYESKRSLILDKLSKDRERSVEEVVGCREALTLIFQQTDDLFPLTETTIRALHQALLAYYPAASAYAGGYKTASNQVVSFNHDTGERRVVLEPAPPGPLTETAMSDLVTWYNGMIRSHPWPLLVATEFVFRFLAIHPFQDGNGRLGRALFLLALMHGADPALRTVVRSASVDRQIERNRSLYYLLLHKTSAGAYHADPTTYRLEPLARFFLRTIEDALADVPILRARYAALNRLSESAIRVLACFKSAPEKQLRVADISAETGLVRRTTQNAITALLAAGCLQRLGAGPSSRYRLLF